MYMHACHKTSIPQFMCDCSTKGNLIFRNHQKEEKTYLLEYKKNLQRFILNIYSNLIWQCCMDYLCISATLLSPETLCKIKLFKKV